MAVVARASHLLGAGGSLALFWNRPVFRTDDLRAEMDEIYDIHAPGMRSSLRGRGARPKGTMYGTVLDHPPIGFRSVERLDLHWERAYTTYQWLSLLGTHSDHRLLDEAAREDLHGAIGDAIDRHGGSFTLPYRVEVVVLEADG